MKNLLFIYKSSLFDYTDLGVGSTNGWRIKASTLTCQLDALSNNTGYIWGNILEEFDLITGIVTGSTKSNSTTDPDYVAPYLDPVHCAVGASPDISLTVFSNRTATATVVFTNTDEDVDHVYTITTATNDIVGAVGGTYNLAITPNTGGSPNANVYINGGAALVVPQGVTIYVSAVAAVDGAITIDIGAHA